jgi:hypothetical protein
VSGSDSTTGSHSTTANTADPKATANATAANPDRGATGERAGSKPVRDSDMDDLKQRRHKNVKLLAMSSISHWLQMSQTGRLEPRDFVAGTRP